MCTEICTDVYPLLCRVFVVTLYALHVFHCHRLCFVMHVLTGEKETSSQATWADRVTLISISVALSQAYIARPRIQG